MWPGWSASPLNTRFSRVLNIELLIFSIFNFFYLMICQRLPNDNLKHAPVVNSTAATRSVSQLRDTLYIIHREYFQRWLPLDFFD